MRVFFLAVLWPLHVYHQKHPVNLIILGLFTVSLSLLVGASCANIEGRYLFLILFGHLIVRWLLATSCAAFIIMIWLLSCIQIFSGKIVLEALILTSAVVCSLTAYTFWAAKKGKDFSFLGPILFTSLIILILTSFIQVRCLIFFKSPSHGYFILCNTELLCVHPVYMSDVMDVLVLCRCSSHLARRPLQFMVELALWFSVDTLFMTLTTWSSASHMMSIFWPLLLSIWTFWTCFFPFCGCWVRETVSCTAYSLQPGLACNYIFDNNWYSLWNCGCYMLLMYSARA